MASRAKLRWCLVVFVMLGATASATEPAHVDYMLNCQGCHLPDGRGFPSRNVPALNNHMAKFLLVNGGREFLVQVPGSAQSDLSDERLTAVLNWMLVTFSPNQVPDTFQPYQTDEVHRLRQSPLIDVKHVRQKLLDQMSLFEAGDNSET